MDSRIEFLIGHIMTHSAVDLFQLLSVGELFNVCILMTIDAFHILMHRTSITLKVHIEGYCPPASFSSQFTIGMTSFTIFIALRIGEAGYNNET
jgi:hypothetical protein